MGDSSQTPSPFDLPGFDLGAIMRLLRSDGPVNWKVAREVANWVSLEGQPDAPITRVEHTKFTELARAAHLLITEKLPFAASLAPEVRILDRRGWVKLNLGSLAPVFENFAATLQISGTVEFVAEDFNALTGEESVSGTHPSEQDALNGLVALAAPFLIGIQAGAMVGHLGKYMLGAYDLPLPVVDVPQVRFVAGNVDEFEKSWSLPHDDFRFYLALHETTHAAVRVPMWVREKIAALTSKFIGLYDIEPGALETMLGGMNPTDMSSLSDLDLDPQALLGAITTPAQHEIMAEMQRFAGVLAAFVDLVVEEIGRPRIPAFSQVREALHRHRVEPGSAEKLIVQLLGVDLRREHYEVGAAFCVGVVERAGFEALSRLWESAAMAPTFAEVEAPGLWLARLEIMAE